VANSEGIVRCHWFNTHTQDEGSEFFRSVPDLAAHLESIGMTETWWGKLIGIDRSTASTFSVASASSTPATSGKTAGTLNLEASL
jgi:hypothetical protein